MPNPKEYQLHHHHKISYNIIYKKMKKTINKLSINYLLFILFILTLCTSFSIHFHNRTQHFQELDSEHIYLNHLFYNSKSTNNNNEIYSNTYFNSKNTNTLIKKLATTKIKPTHFKKLVIKLLKLSFIDNLIEKRCALKFGENYTKDKKQLYINQIILTKTNNSVYFLRATIHNLIRENTHIPYSIKIAFSLPKRTTYSFGSGLIYGLFTNKNNTYEQIMSRSIIVNLILFHLSILIITLVLLKLRTKKTTYIISYLLLFSICHYSYSYHLGSTMWNIFSLSLWIGILTFNWNKKNILSIISITTGVLIFFNYLIIFFWLSFLISLFLIETLKKNTSIKPLFYTGFKIVKSQYHAIFLITLCVLVFFPPGEGNRGNITSIETLLTYTYYIILNFFSFFSKNTLINLVQFAIGTFLVSLYLISIYKDFSLYFKNKNIYINNLHIINFLKIFSLVFTTIFIATAAINILGIAPSRHILFISPLLFIMIGIAIDETINKYNLQKTISPIILLLLFLGFIGIKTRLPETQYDIFLKNNKLLEESCENYNKYEGLILIETSLKLKNAIFKYYPELAKIPLLEKTNGYLFDTSILNKNKRYLHITQTELSSLKKTPTIKVLQKSKNISNTYFVTNNPTKTRHNRPNHLIILDFITTEP
jgi:hypothetical protein